MTDSKQVEKRAERREPDIVLRPAVDIYEDANGIRIDADLPGVATDRLDIQVDRDTLTIDGDVAIDMPGDMEATYADVRAARYHRGFTLSRELDSENISAEMKDGVLTLLVPKRVEHQPRKIEIRDS